jgi:hypothetical protein
MIRRGCLLWLLFIPWFVFAQENTVVCQVKIPVISLHADRLNRIYVLNSSGLFQYDNQCNLLASFTKKLAGGITSVDVSNPLKILVFSRAEQKIYVLNDQLHVQSEISLADLGIIQAVVVCNSRGDGFRVYDQATHKLLRFDYTLNLIQENILSPDIKGNFDPVKMDENEKFIAIGNRKSGILLFDRYGNYQHAFSSVPEETFYLTDSEIAFTKGDTLIFQNSFKVNENKTELLPVANQIAVRIDSRWIFYDSAGFSIAGR